MGREHNEKESLWWNEDTRRAITAKEEAFKAYQKDKSEEQHCAYKDANKAVKRAVAMAKEQHCSYKEANKAAKRAVAMAKEEAYEELYT